MSGLRAITLRLAPDDYDRLEAEAQRLGVPTATLVRIYVRAQLSTGEPGLGKQARIGLDALDRLAGLTTGLPAVDAVQTVRESREELGARLNP